MDSQSSVNVGSCEDPSDRVRPSMRVSPASADSMYLAFESGRIGWWSTDLRTGEVRWSAEMERLFGLEPGSFSGSAAHYMSLVYSEDRDYVESAVADAISTGQDYAIECRIVRSDGEMRWIESRGTFQFDESGHPVSTHGVSIDVTERASAEASRAVVAREIRESEARYRYLAESVPAMVFTAKPSGEIDYANSRWSGFFGKELKDILGDAWRTVCHPDDYESAVAGFARSIGTGSPYEAEYRILRKDGEFRWHLCRAVPMNDAVGQISGWFGTIVDIHEQKTRERLLAFLTDLIDVTSRMRRGTSIVSASCHRLGRHLETTGCAYAEYDSGLDEYVIANDYANGPPSLEGAYSANEWGWDDLELFSKSGGIGIADVKDSNLPSELKERYLAANIRAVIAVGRQQHRNLSSVMFAYQSHPRQWSRDDLQLLRLVAERCATDIDRVKSATAAAQSEERFRRILEAATVGVIVNDQQGTFRYANPPLLEMLGFTVEELEAGELTWDRVQAHERKAQDDVALDQLRESGRCDPYETEYVAKDGSRVPVYVGAAFLPGDKGEDQLGAAFVTDLSGLKEAEYELIKLNEELDLRVKERTAELEAAYEDQESYNYSISHDLRAPLRAIVGTSRIIEEDHGEALTEGARALLKRQIQSANRLGVLVDDLLKLSRVGRQEMRFEHVDMSALAKDVTVELGAEHRVRIPEGMYSRGDGALLRLVWQNLIGNALKFSPEDTVVEVGYEPSGPETTYWVRDFGIGFDMMYSHKLFLPFERLVTEAEFPGMGIGLTNVSKVIQRHHGSVWAQSQPSKGATFYFAIPNH